MDGEYLIMLDYLIMLFASSDISGNIIHLKLKLCMSVQYGGRLMSIGTVNNRYMHVGTA